MYNFILGNVLGLDEWHLPICHQNPLFSCENACTKSGMCWFSVVSLIENSDGCASYRFCLDFPFWMCIGVRYHCYYLYSVVCQHIWHNVLPLFFPRYTGVKTTQHYKLFISNPIVLFWRTKQKTKKKQQNRTYSEPPPYRRTSGKINACKK